MPGLADNNEKNHFIYEKILKTYPKLSTLITSLRLHTEIYEQ